jgi:N-methylhydantoinase A
MKGGTLPATTDANVVLGYLDPDFFAGGKMKLDVAAARKAIDEHIARPMGLTVEQAAAGMYRVACNNMAQGVREVTIKRGFDPREFPFISAGGAGPIHSCLICRELEIPLQIVPRESSVLCAFGMLMSELKHDFVRTFVARLGAIDWVKLGRIIDDMSREGARQLAEERIHEAKRRFEVRFDCRYIKQYHEVSFPLPRELIAGRDTAAIACAFHAEHSRLYGYSLEQENTPVEIINLRVQAIGLTDKPHYKKESRAGADATAAAKGRRSVYIPEANAFEDIPVYDGHSMRFGNRIAGPAMIEQETTAIFVSASYDCVVDVYGSFALYQKGREDLVRICMENEAEAIA